MAKTQLERSLEHKGKGKNSGIAALSTCKILQNWLAVDGFHRCSLGRFHQEKRVGG